MFQITGLLKEVTPIVSGTSAQGNTWQKCEVRVEVAEGQYNTLYCLTAFNKEISIPVGSAVVCDFYVKTNNYNGKYYTNLMLHDMRLGVQQQVHSQPMQTNYAPNGYQQPMTKQPMVQTPPQQPVGIQQNRPMTGIQPMPQIPQQGGEEQFDDMPF